jgi:para-aminobenzoate synthetase component 1
MTLSECSHNRYSSQQPPTDSSFQQTYEVSDHVGFQRLELDRHLQIPDALQRFQGQPFLLLLDSAARHREQDARYSFLTADPIAIHRLDRAEFPMDPFQPLRHWQQQLAGLATDAPADLPPFAGGIAGLMSYELGEAFERLPRPAPDDFRTPAILAGLFDWSIVWDHLTGTVTAWVLDLASDVRRSLSTADRLHWIRQHLEAPGGDTGSSPASSKGSSDFQPSGRYHRIEPTTEVYSDFSRDEYVSTVARVIEYIRAGDIFQANLSQRLLAPWQGTAVDLYRRVRQRNPAPFCGLLQHEDVAIVSASPERFLKVGGTGRVETRPIKGTRRRQASPIADLFVGNELASSEKDRAENVMIVDLLRNDLSRSCGPGTVRVTGLCEIERFETVLHLVSTVVGQLRTNLDVWNLMAGCFPGGSITGAPKIRAMEIIAELERSVRGAYCGSFFACGPRGDFDSSILIRTFTMKGGWVQFPVGGGIVADSDPLDEYRETLHKASGMIRVLRSL